MAQPHGLSPDPRDKRRLQSALVPFRTHRGLHYLHLSSHAEARALHFAVQNEEAMLRSGGQWLHVASLGQF